LNVFECLAKKTRVRDTLKWHTPRPLTQPPRLENSCKFARVIISGTSLPEVGNKHPTPDVIKDCGEGPPMKAKGAKTNSAPAPKLKGNVKLPHEEGSSAAVLPQRIQVGATLLSSGGMGQMLQRQTSFPDPPPVQGQINLSIDDRGRVSVTVAGPANTPVVKQPTIGIRRDPNGKYHLL